MFLIEMKHIGKIEVVGTAQQQAYFQLELVYRELCEPATNY
jgi:hypothetical protein